MNRSTDGAYPEATPRNHGLLDVGGGHWVYWEVCGNPNGKPALVVHGGPGSGATPWWTTHFDPDRYRVVLFDQRNCGRSLPHASEPNVDLSTNTTPHLIADIELLREHLGIDRWLVFGGSWGSTLGLAYAVTYPERVTELCLFAVVTTRAHEIEWLTRTMGHVFPEQWERFVSGVPPEDRDGNLAAAYNRLLFSPDPEVRERASLAWADWEDALVSLEGNPPSRRFEDPRFRLAFTRIVTRYFAAAAFLADNAITGHLDRVAQIPAVLVRGRLDIGSPLSTAWQLAKRLPRSELFVLEETGHAGAAAMTSVLVEATDRFAQG